MDAVEAGLFCKLLVSKIHIPAGTNYLFTGEYSNTPDSNELILDIGTVLKIIEMKQNGEIIYIDAVVENNVHNSIEK